MKKKLYRSRDNKIISGVCGGIAEYLDVDTTIVRLLWVLSVIFAGTGVLAYILCIFIIPEEPNGEYEEDEIEEEAMSVDESIEEKGKGKKKEKDNSNTIGLIFIIVGMLFMAKKIMWWLDFNIDWNLFFPGLFIIFGIYLIAKKKR